MAAESYSVLVFFEWFCFGDSRYSCVVPFRLIWVVVHGIKSDPMGEKGTRFGLERVVFTHSAQAQNEIGHFTSRPVLVCASNV